jgi:cell wall-associated NlpC family hydrolase
VVACARGWIGTPFHHQARLKGVGVDCAGLVIGVARELGLVPEGFDINGYPRQPDGQAMLRWCREHMQEVAFGTLKPGHVVVVRFDRHPQHVGLVGNYWHGEGVHSIIHALSLPPARVVETRLMFTRAMQPVAAFALPGVA